jgi:hypothetical protein
MEREIKIHSLYKISNLLLANHRLHSFNGNFNPLIIVDVIPSYEQ